MGSPGSWSGSCNRVSDRHLRVLGMNFTFIFWMQLFKKIEITSCTLAALHDFYYFAHEKALPNVFVKQKIKGRI